MGRAGALCQLCPQQSRRGHHRAHRNDPVQWCAEATCRRHVCARHAVYDPSGDRWLCARCARGVVTDAR